MWLGACLKNYPSWSNKALSTEMFKAEGSVFREVFSTLYSTSRSLIPATVYTCCGFLPHSRNLKLGLRSCGNAMLVLEDGDTSGLPQHNLC